MVNKLIWQQIFLLLIVLHSYISVSVGVSLLWPGSTLSRLQCVSCDVGTSQCKQVKCSNHSTDVQYFPVMILKNCPSFAFKRFALYVVCAGRSIDRPAQTTHLCRQTKKTFSTPPQQPATPSPLQNSEPPHYANDETYTYCCLIPEPPPPYFHTYLLIVIT